MLPIPYFVLKKLSCAKCSNYLSCGPILVSQNQEQFCGKCSKILTDEIKSNCVREIGLEAVAEILNFPCKYNIQGCQETFSFNTGWEHESNCLYKNHSLSTTISRKNLPNCNIYENQQMQMKSICSNSNNENLKIDVEVTSKPPNKLHLNSEEIRVNLQMAINTDNYPEITYSHLTCEKIQEEIIYDSVCYALDNLKCVNCKINLAKIDIFLCCFGHSLCKLCKNEYCKICDTIPNSRSFRYCKNYVKGCTGLFSTCDISKHEIDCEFNDFQCPKCVYKNILFELRKHFIATHEVILNNELLVRLDKKDQQWFFYCFTKLFCCKYFNYGNNFDIVLIYIGSNENVQNHKYEVSLISSNLDISKKKAKCLGWNEISLGKGVNFEITNNLRKNLQIKIVIS